MPDFVLAVLPLDQTGISDVNRLPSWGATGPKELIIKILNVLLTVAGLIAVLFIIIGGFQYILSGANEELAERGKKTLQNAIIGIVIIILAYVIVNVINTALG